MSQFWRGYILGIATPVTLCIVFIIIVLANNNIEVHRYSSGHNRGKMMDIDKYRRKDNE